MYTSFSKLTWVVLNICIPFKKRFFKKNVRLISYIHLCCLYVISTQKLWRPNACTISSALEFKTLFHHIVQKGGKHRTLNILRLNVEYISRVRQEFWYFNKCEDQEFYKFNIQCQNFGFYCLLLLFYFLNIFHENV